MAASQVENWDEDLELQGDIFSNSLGTVKTSMSSRHSLHSESNPADDEWNVPLPSNDKTATSHAIDHAKLAGIPIPSNVPASALVGGSIKRLGKKRSRAHISTDDWAEDLQMPQTNNGRLELKHRKPVVPEEEDVFDEWAEGSLGIRFGGTHKADRSNRDSSMSILSPSMGSINTLETDDDDMNGLDLGGGQVDFAAALKKQQSTHTPSNSIPMSIDSQFETPTPRQGDSQRDDFFDGIETDFLDSSKRTAHRNVRPKGNSGTPQTATKTQTTLTFGEKDKVNTKIPRPVPSIRTGRLEPVQESSTPSFGRNFRRPEPTTTTAQLLRAKRSMPVLGRTDQGHFRQQPSLAAAARQPFRAGANISNKPQFHSRRDSDPHRPGSPARPSSRLSQTLTPDTPTRQRRDIASNSLAREAAAKRTVTKPNRRRNFGDGTELDLFDDLPTSAAKESRYMKPVSTKPTVTKMRSQPSISRIASRDRMVTPSLTGPPPSIAPRSPSKTDSLPRFARDTASSRIAREQKLGHTTSTSNLKEKGPFSNRVNWQAQVAARSPAHSPSANRSSRKGLLLIKAMDKENVHSFQADAAKKGMNWNPVTHCWEGNEHVLAPFEPPAPPSPPRPALITNVGRGSTAMQVVGGMVFDPTQMRWLKIGANGRSNPGSPSVETEDDPFKDIPDLEDETKRVSTGVASDAGPVSEYDVREEFDLGPAFIARQREEEAAWRSRCDAWFVDRPDEGEAWKYAILSIVGDDL